MSGLLDGLLNELGNDGTGEIASRLGVEPSQAQAALQGALPMILAAMANNAAGGGADALHNALQQHAGPGSVQQQIRDVTQNPAAMADGNAILGHIFGARQDTVAQGVSGISGIDPGKAGALLSMLAPLVMSYIGKHMTQNGMDSGQLSSTLGRQANDLSGDGIVGGLINAVLGGGQQQPQAGGLDVSDILAAGSSILGAFNKR